MSHDNLTWLSRVIVDDLTFGAYQVGQERILSFMPLSHVIAQIGDIHNGIRMGATVYFADKDALKGTLVTPDNSTYVPTVHTLCCVATADPGVLPPYVPMNCLKVKNLQEVRPTRFFTVPRLWEKVQERLQEQGKKSGPLRRRLLLWSRAQAAHHYAKLRAAQEGQEVTESVGYRVARRLVFR